MNILITGSTGNIGRPLIQKLVAQAPESTIYAAVQKLEGRQPSSPDTPNLHYVAVDFENATTFEQALHEIDIVFLLRPPQISDIDTYFKPFIEKMVEKSIKKVVFLSVQGAEQSTIIPHRKIELLLEASGMDYIFMRPSYFMQNLTTTLLSDIQKKRAIILPSGNAVFNWLDIVNIAELAVIFLTEFEHYKNQAYVISGTENLNFKTVVEKINAIANTNIAYRKVSPLTFYRLKRKDKLPKGLVIVMLLLHFLPRLQEAPAIEPTYQRIIGREPRTLDQFIQEHIGEFQAA